MGEKECAFEGCNALEFRTSGYCLRHKDGQAEITPLTMKSGAPAISRDLANSPSVKENTGTIMMLIGIIMLLIGGLLLFDDYVVGQMAGGVLLVIGYYIALIGLKLHGKDRIKSIPGGGKRPKLSVTMPPSGMERIRSILFWQPPGLARFVVFLALIAYSFVIV